MKKEDFEKITESMQEKLGKENSSLIADDIATLITDYSNMNKEIDNKNKQIEKLKNDKENLITANGNLLQQVSMGFETKEEISKDNKKEEIKKFSFKNCFDEKGNFIK